MLYFAKEASSDDMIFRSIQVVLAPYIFRLKVYPDYG